MGGVGESVRWWPNLSELDFEGAHGLGAKNQTADSLSCLLTPLADYSPVKNDVTVVMTADELPDSKSAKT